MSFGSGFLVKGVLYMVIGALAVQVAARAGGHAVLGWQAFRLYRGLSAASGTSEREVATEAFRWPLGD